MKQAIIFDFDGTIADSFEAVVDIFEHLTKRPHKLSDRELAELRGLPPIAVAERLHVSLWRIPFLLWKGRWLMGNYIDKIQPFTGISELVRRLHEEGYVLYVMSSNSAQNVRRFLRNHQLDTYFQEVQGNVGIFSKGKAIKRFINHHQLNPAYCVYVGDETRDIESARDASVPCISVTWGFAEPGFLRQLNPRAVAETPQDIIQLIQLVKYSNDSKRTPV